MNYLKNLDFNGRIFNLGVEREEKFKTLFGASLSFLIIFGYIASFWYFGKDIYERTKASIFTETKVFPAYPIRNISNSDFFFGIRIEESGKALVDPRYVEYVFETRQYINTANSSLLVNVSKQYMNYCNSSNLPEDVIKNERLENFLCPNINNVKFGGSFGISPEIGYAKISINLCNQQTEKRLNITCFPKKDIINRIQNLYFTYILRKKLINQNSFDHPIIDSYNYEEKRFSGFLNDNKYHYSKFFFRLSNITDDTGIIFEDVTKTQEFIEFESREDEQRTIESSEIVRIVFYLNKVNMIYKRMYIKMAAIAATAGGFMSLAIPILNLIFDVFINCEYKLYLIKSLFELEKLQENSSEKIFEMNKIEHNSNNLNSKQINQECNFEVSTDFVYRKKCDSIENNIFKDNASEKDIILNYELRKLINFKTKKKEKINISYTQLLLGLGKKSKFLELVDFELRKKLDGIRLLYSTDHFRLLTKLILNESQEFMLKNRDKQNIIYNENIENNIDDVILLEKEKIDKKKSNLIQYLKSKALTGNDNLYDRTLFYFVNDELQNEVKTEFKELRPK